MTTHEQRDDFGAKFGMWLFLFTELILFGGLFILYAVYLQRYPAEFKSAGHELNRFFGTLNTVILLSSSLTAALAVTTLQQGKHKPTLILLWTTVACAGLFMVNKYFEWSAKFHHGIYPGAPRLLDGPPGENVFFSLYYLTTGLHGLHVLIGAALLGWVALKVKKGTVSGGNFMPLENVVLYWHLVDLIWIFVFPLYYLVL